MGNILKKSVVAGVSFFFTAGILSFAYATYTTSIPAATNGGNLTSDAWNTMVTEISALGDSLSNFSFSSGNVGIGVPTPSVKLEVAGNIIAATPTSADHVATKAYVDAAMGGGKYMGMTAASYDGSMGGITGVNAKCQINYAGSHICSIREIRESGQTTGIIGYGWTAFEHASALSSNYFFDGVILNGGIGSNYTVDCNNWNSNGVSYMGLSLGTTYLNRYACNSTYPIHCCK